MMHMDNIVERRCFSSYGKILEKIPTFSVFSVLRYEADT